MKKKLLAAAVVLTAVLMLGGCEGLSAKNAKGPETEESCLYITKDGNLQWVSVETYEGGSYSKEELLDFASEKIKEYNEANGTENEKEPVKLVSGSLENGKAVLITSYDSGESLIDFARADRQEIFQVRNLLIVNQDVWVLHHTFHLFCISYEVS